VIRKDDSTYLTGFILYSQVFFYSSIYNRKYVLLVIKRDGMVNTIAEQVYKKVEPSLDIIIERKDVE